MAEMIQCDAVTYKVAQSSCKGTVLKDEARAWPGLEPNAKNLPDHLDFCSSKCLLNFVELAQHGGLPGHPTIKIP